MTEIHLTDEDVLSMEPEDSPIGDPTVQVSEILNFIEGQTRTSAWLTDGAPCRVLRASGGGWKSGKVFIRLSFAPDEDNG
ncbi:MAG: KGK domain-containing protein [Crinalium sp.]